MVGERGLLGRSLDLEAAKRAKGDDSQYPPTLLRDANSLTPSHPISAEPRAIGVAGINLRPALRAIAQAPITATVTARRLRERAPTAPKELAAFTSAGSVCFSRPYEFL
jgi:hypothetical protein